MATQFSDLDKSQAAKIIAIYPELSAEQLAATYDLCGPAVQRLVEDTVAKMVTGEITRIPGAADL